MNQIPPGPPNEPNVDGLGPGMEAFGARQPPPPPSFEDALAYGLPGFGVKPAQLV